MSTTTYDARHKRYYQRNRAVLIEKAKKRYKENYPEYLFKRFGLLPREYAELLARSQNCCEICGLPPGKRKLAIDHDHITKGIRGLLCSRCNRALSRTVSTPGWFDSAAAYLKKPQIKTMNSLLQATFSQVK